jgi:hypothetical protein
MVCFAQADLTACCAHRQHRAQMTTKKRYQSDHRSTGTSRDGITDAQGRKSAAGLQTMSCKIDLAGTVRSRSLTCGLTTSSRPADSPIHQMGSPVIYSPETVLWFASRNILPRQEAFFTLSAPGTSSRRRTSLSIVNLPVYNYWCISMLPIRLP